jgi:DNA-binding transcriptional regulator YiaG
MMMKSCAQAEDILKISSIPLNLLCGYDLTDRLGGLRATAKAMGCTVPNLSQRHKKLEDLLGIELFQQSIEDLRRQEVSEAGELILEAFREAQPALMRLGEALAQVKTQVGISTSNARPSENADFCPQSLGSRISSLRRRQGIGIHAFAQQIGVSAPSVHQWEKGNTRPTEEHLALVAEALGVSPEYLLGESPSPSEPISDE